MGHIHLILAALVFVRGRECVYVCVWGRGCGACLMLVTWKLAEPK